MIIHRIALGDDINLCFKTDSYSYCRALDSESSEGMSPVFIYYHWLYIININDINMFMYIIWGNIGFNITMRYISLLYIYFSLYLHPVNWIVWALTCAMLSRSNDQLSFYFALSNFINHDKHMYEFKTYLCIFINFKSWLINHFLT